MIELKLVILSLLILGLSLSGVVASVSEEEASSIALELFNTIVPKEAQSEYSIFNIETDVAGRVYWVTWNREINGIPVYEERFFVRIYVSNGEVINHEFTYSGGSPEEFETTKVLTKWQAESVATNSYPVSRVVESPELYYANKKLVWMTTLELEEEDGRKPWLWIGLDANTGETVVFEPSDGSNIEQVETSFTPPFYQPLLLHPEYAILIISIGVISYLKKESISKILKM